MMRTRILFLLFSFHLCLPVPAQDKGPRLPNPKLTPGRAIAVTATELCKRGYKSPHRKIPIALKCRVFGLYRIYGYKIGYNVDRLIPTSLGGSISIYNLWSQPLAGEWCWHRKNKLEKRLRKLVCGGHLDLKTAQQEIATNWISAYKKYVGERQ